MDRLYRDSDGPANGAEVMRFDGTVWQSGAATRWLGRLSMRMAMVVLIAAALLGVVVSVALGQEPGDVLGFFVIMGSIAAALGVRSGKAYLVFPMPALMFFVAAIVVGKIHDAKLGSSTASLGAGFTQWVAAIFFPAVVATVLVLLIGGARWIRGRQFGTGQSVVLPSGPARPSPPRGTPRMAPMARPAPRSRRPVSDPFDRIDPDFNQPDRDDPEQDDSNRDDWMDDKPFEDQQAFKTEMIPVVRPDRPAKSERPERTSVLGDGNQRPARPPRDRDQRGDRDQWGGLRLPPDRAKPSGTGPRPNAQPRPGTQPRPSAQPREGGAPRPSFKPNQPNQRNPSQRPQRRQPPEGWKPR